MRFPRRAAVLVVGLLTLALVGPDAVADDVTTTAGKKLTGKLTAVDAKGVSFAVGEGKVEILARDIVLVDLGNKEPVFAKDAPYVEIELTDGSTFNRPDGGMFVWARLPEGWDADELLQRALEHDVAFVPGHPFYARDADARTLRLSFTTHVPNEIAEGLARLRRSWSSAA